MPSVTEVRRPSVYPMVKVLPFRSLIERSFAVAPTVEPTDFVQSVGPLVEPQHMVKAMRPAKPQRAVLRFTAVVTPLEHDRQAPSLYTEIALRVIHVPGDEIDRIAPCGDRRIDPIGTGRGVCPRIRS